MGQRQPAWKRTLDRCEDVLLVLSLSQELKSLSFVVELVENFFPPSRENPVYEQLTQRRNTGEVEGRANRSK